MWKLFQFSLFLMGAAFADIITLKKDKNVTCVLTEKDIDSGVYLRPFSTKNVFPQNTSKVLWVKRDWLVTDSNAVQFKPIQDSRWNDLPAFNIKSYRPPRKKLGLTLSVCSVDSILRLHLQILRKPEGVWSDSIFNITVPTRKPEYCTWVHFTIYNKNGWVALINDSFVDIRKNLSADAWFRLGQFKNVYLVKRHLYNFLWSEHHSNDPSILNVQFFAPGQVCVHFYVSIDLGSQLEILVKDGYKVVSTLTIDGFNIARELKSWKYVKIERTFEGVSPNGTMELYRKKTAKVPGFWAIDSITYCHHNAAIYKGTLDSDEEQATCQSLEHHDENTPELFEKNTAVGCLSGNKCELTCKQVLGLSYNDCQEHRICLNDQCSCAWGYKGDLCKEECSSGTWGMDCSYKCDESCIHCNPRNGSCKDFIVGFTSTSSTQMTIKNNTQTTSSLASRIYVPTASQTITSHRIIKSTSVTSTTTFTTSVKTRIHLNIDTKVSKETTRPSEDNERHSSNINYFLVLGLVFLFLLVLFLLLRHYFNRKMSRTPVSDVPDLGHSKVSVSDFDNYIRRSVAEGFLVNQFNTLDNKNKESSTAALEPINLIKNYDRINIPYDRNRVVMEPMDNVGTSDYINASYIDGWGRNKAYIVTQGPKSKTISDFWRMVWQQDIKTIVMASNFRENMKRECVEYLPLYLDAILPVGEFNIKFVKEECHEYYQKRILEVYYDRYHKVVTHYYLNWRPEHRKPIYPNDLVPLVQIMNENYGKKDWSPILVHCSLGIGRSAILILCDIAFEMAKREGYVDVYDAAKMLREQRPNMITSTEDYILAHLVISECLMAQVQVFTRNIDQLNSLSINRQFEYLNTWKWHDDIVDNLSGYDQCSNVPYVEYWDRYGSRTKYYYAKQPQTKDMELFWRTVLNEKIKTILFLNESAFKPYLFRLKLSERVLCTADHVSSFQNAYSILSKMFVKEQDVRTTTLYEAEIVFFQLLGWKPKALKDARACSIENLIQFVEDVRNLEPVPKRILVCCSNGISDCGLFIAMSFIIRKYLKEVEYDIPNAIRSLRRNNIRFMSKSDELRILYEAIEIYSQKFDPYNTVDNDTAEANKSNK